MTYRWREHVGPGEDYALGYRDREEAQPWLDGDPVRRLADMVRPEVRARLEAEVEQEIRDAFAFAEASPFPGPEALLTDNFSEEPICLPR